MSVHLKKIVGLLGSNPVNVSCFTYLGKNMFWEFLGDMKSRVVLWDKQLKSHRKMTLSSYIFDHEIYDKELF